jgi:hypothetical protein
MLNPLTSSVEDSPAKISASPGRAQDSTERARVFGASTPVSLASFDRDTCSWRTSQLSLLEEWDEFSGTWPRSGMTRSGTAFQLAPLAPLTGGTGSGLWPTPSVCGNYNHKGASVTSGDGLATVVGGSLNPAWVEWLMGYPLGWTDLGGSATRSSRKSRNK